MKLKHSAKFVDKIIDEFNYTLTDVRNQVNEYTGRDYDIVGSLIYLRRCTADYMRMVLRFNTFRKEGR